MLFRHMIFIEAAFAFSAITSAGFVETA